MSIQKLPALEQLIQTLAPGTGDSGNVTAALERILMAAQTHFGPDFCTIAAINPITGSFILPMAFRGSVRNEDRFRKASPRPDGITRHVLTEGALFVEDLAQQPEYQNNFTILEEVRAFAAIPLVALPHNKPLAVLYLDYRQPRYFSADDQALLRLLVEQSTFLLHQTWLFYRFADVTRIGQEINLELDTIDQLFAKLQGLVANILDTSHFFMLAVYQAQTDLLDLYMFEDGKIATLPDDPVNGVCRWVIREQQPLLIKRRSVEPLDPTIDPIALDGTAGDEEALMFVPLTIRDVPLGVLSAQSRLPNTYDEDDLQILRLLANHVALALSNIRLFDNLRQLNHAGQFLTQRLHSALVLQNVVDNIRAATQADLVTLYPYNVITNSFEVPPRVSGEFLVPAHPQTISSEHDHIAFLTVGHTAPIFAKESKRLYRLLGGDPTLRLGFFSQRERVLSVAATPLRVGGVPVGALFINFRQPQRFEAPQKQLIEGLASYAAIAIANARAFDTLVQRRTHELEALQQIDRALSQTLDLQPTLATILRLAVESIPATRACIYLYDEPTNSLRTEALLSEADPIYRRFHAIPIHQQRGLVWWVFTHRQPVRVDNVQTDPQWREQYMPVASDILSELDAPLIDAGRAIGVINFESTHEAAFSESDAAFLVTLAGQAVLAIKNAQAYEREKRLADERQALIAIGNQILRQPDLQQVFTLILEKARAMTASPAGTLMLYDRRQNHLWMAAERGVRAEQKHQPHSLDEGIVGMVARTERLLNVPDVTQPPWDKIHLSFIPNVRAELAVPLLEDGMLRGVLNLEHETPNHYTANDERLLSALSDQAMIALQTAERYQKAEERQQRLRALHGVDERIIGQTDDPILVIQAVLENALRLTGAEAGDLHLYIDGTPTQTYFAVTQADRVTFAQVSIDDTAATAIQRGIVAHVASTRRPYYTVADAQSDLHYQGNATDAMHSEVAVPLLAGKRLVGVLNLESPRYYAFDDDDVEILSLLAGQAVIAIQNARAYLRARLLDRVGRELATIANASQIDEAYAIVQRYALQLHSNSQITVRRYDSVGDVLQLVSWVETHPIKPDRIKSLQGLNGHVAQIRQTLLVSDAHDPLFGHLLLELAPEARSWMGTPILFNDHYYGNMALTMIEANSVLEADQLLLEGLAQQLAITIHRLETAQALLDERQRNREAQIMSSMGQSAMELAHRLGGDLGPTPSTVNRIKRALAGQKQVDASVTAELDAVLGDVQKVLTLVKELKRDLHTLDEEQAMSREPASLRVRDLVEQTLSEHLHRPANVRVQIAIGDDTAMVRAVLREVADILRNLYMNAIEAMPKGGTITWHTQTVGPMVEICITDTGKGITNKNLARIFDLFYSSKGSSGFGLWSAQQYALGNDGSLTVVSQVGKGTSFTLALPRARNTGKA